VQDNDKTDRNDIPGDAASVVKGRLASDVTGRGDITGPDTGATHGQPQRLDRGAAHIPGRGDVTARDIGDNPSQAVPTERVADVAVPEGDSIPGQGDTTQQASTGIDSSSDIRSAADMTGPDGGAMQLPARDTSATEHGH
jgi:hypothetical protein